MPRPLARVGLRRTAAAQPAVLRVCRASSAVSGWESVKKALESLRGGCWSPSALAYPFFLFLFLTFFFPYISGWF